MNHKWENLQTKVDNCKNETFRNNAKALIKHKSKLHQSDNIHRLLDLASSEIDKVYKDEQKNINYIIQYTNNFLEDNRHNNDLQMRTYSNLLDNYRNWPNWLQKLVGFVLIIMTVALITAAIALVLSLTGGSAAALVAPVIALVKPLIDVLAATSVFALVSATTGLTATTAATISLAGAGAMVAIGTGLGSYCSMYKPYTNCIEKIITANSKAANN